MTLHQRRSTRLKDYDYTQNGAYFVTICAHDRRPVFGAVVNAAVALSACGRIVQACWDEIPMHYPRVELDAFVVMPNHIHGILMITHESVGATHGSPVQTGANGSPVPTHAIGPQRNSLGAIIGQFKSSVTRRINRLPDARDHPIWQRNYYEHIIRNEQSLDQIRAYVATNPARWAEDSLYTQ